ncbi:MAG TPA: D-2-hydroxyacid dehydrogenase [Anaerolineaceae bacterium]|nr:D-2-hydroxyacid dehydrogenase [Anaerolineaceae bacterium]
MSASLIEVLITIPFAEPLVEQLKAVSPRLRITVHPANRPEEIPAEVWGRCEVLLTDRVLPLPVLVPNLRWVQFYFAGIDFAVDAPLLRKPDLIVTTLSGAAAGNMAEFALTMLLALGHRLPEMAVLQARSEWPSNRGERLRAVELRGSTVGIVGYGSIGRELARMLVALGATVLAAKRDVLHPEDKGYMPPGMGDPDGDLFTRLYPIEALCSMLKECDFVVVTVPLTPQTRGLIGVEELAVMKPGVYLVNISRGAVLDQNAVYSALQEKRLAGAALDVFVDEPLPASSPLWKLPNLIISPHISGFSQKYNERAAEMFAENLRLYVSGGTLFNRFDQEKGY